ncbi:uncharacterized protein LOC135941143 [Cloeon dipterum]|uniref:uncharacterized protein LOC135941143 n=1 Tax=Cloeon dipterum TaxID=197152 RepID=UPI00321F98B7
MRTHQDTWACQMRDAMNVNGGDLENATNIDYLMHFLTFGWKFPSEGSPDRKDIIMDVMIDRMKLKIAEARLVKLQSLRDRACKKVLKNILDGRINGPQLVTANLPKKLRENLMRRFESQMCLPGQQSIEEFDRRYEAFESLLPANKIDLQALMSYCPLDYGTQKRMLSKADLENKKNLVKSLSNLRVLLFKEKNLCLPSNDTRTVRYQTWFERLCIDKLPNLKVFQQMADHTAGTRSAEKFEIPDMIRKSLQHLTTAQGVEGMHLMFPSVTHLRVDKMNEEKDWSNLLQFPIIESLQICHSPPTAIEPFLAQYGANLRTLVLSEMKGVLFRQIFELCPNLEVLSLQNVIVDDDTNFLFDFAKLKKLYWKPNNSKQAHISNILAAPDLKTLEMFGNSFDWRDIEKFSALISMEKILRKLVTLKYVGRRPYLPLENNYLEEENFHLFSAMCKLIKNSMAFIPKLSDVSFFMCCGCSCWESWNSDIAVGKQIEDMTPDPSYCNCLTASVCKELKDETIFDFLEAFNRRNLFLPERGEF